MNQYNNYFIIRKINAAIPTQRTHEFGESADGHFASPANKLKEPGSFLIIHRPYKLFNNIKN